MMAESYLKASDQGKVAAENAALRRKAEAQDEQIGDLQAKMLELQAMVESGKKQAKG
jgi:hypothetical protein